GAGRDHVLAVLPGGVRVAGEREVRRGGGQMRHGGQADAEVGVGVHRRRQAEGVAHGGHVRGAYETAPVVVVQEEHADGAGGHGGREVFGGDHAHVGGERHGHGGGDLAHALDARRRV